jgi:hypothetical protein
MLDGFFDRHSLPRPAELHRQGFQKDAERVDQERREAYEHARRGCHGNAPPRVAEAMFVADTETAATGELPMLTRTGSTLTAAVSRERRRPEHVGVPEGLLVQCRQSHGSRARLLHLADKRPALSHSIKTLLNGSSLRARWVC